MNIPTAIASNGDHNAHATVQYSVRNTAATLSQKILSLWRNRWRPRYILASQKASHAREKVTNQTAKNRPA